MILTRTTPGKAGIPPKAILNFIDALEEKKLGVHSFMLLRHGQVAAEGWWKPYAPEKTHMLFSLSKSFTSTAVGFAVEEGLLSIDDKVLSFFEGELPCTPCANMCKMTVKNLLTMGTGHDKEPQIFSHEPKWFYRFLTSYVACEPGTKFTYNTPATYMLSCIVQKITGQTVFDYLKPRLFDALGIKDIWWESSPDGVNMGGFGLNLHTEDIAKFAQFLLNKGMVDGKQLLNREWIEMATSKQISNGDPNEPNDWSQGYGFQFWRCQRPGVYRGDGAFGQYCVVMPEQDACLAMTSGSGNIGQILKEAWAHLLPAMGDACADDGLDELNARIQSLGICLPTGEADSPCAARAQGAYAVSQNHFNIKRISFDFSGAIPRADIVFNQDNKNAMQTAESSGVLMGCGEWLESGEGENHLSAAYAWQADGALKMVLVEDATPFMTELTVQFKGDFAVLTLKRNVGEGSEGCVLYAKRESENA